MLRAYSIQAVRDAEAEVVAKAAPDELMQLAAHGVADTCQEAIIGAEQTVAGSTVMALIGGGDNGGDGLYASSYLAQAGAQVVAILLHANVHERALAAAKAAGVTVWAPDLEDSPSRIARGVVNVARDAGVWIDAIAGTGCTGRLRRPQRDIVRALEQEREASPDEPFVIAVDLPSGIGGDDGAIVGPHLRAHRTVTMGQRKASSLLAPAMYSYGRVRTVDIGLPYLGECYVSMLEAADVGDQLLVPGPQDHKYTRGVVQVIAGSRDYPMTGVMCATAAAHAGAGMVRYSGPDEAVLALVSRLPEAVPGVGRHQALVVGPGIVASDGERVRAAKAAIRDAAASNTPAVLDAGALELVPQMRNEVGANCVLTPHAGEAATLLTALGIGSRRGGITRDQVETEPAHWCSVLAERTGATVVLKGGQTLVSRPGGLFYACNEAPGWAGTAGSGDTLAGIIGAVLAAAQAQAQQNGEHLHGKELSHAVAVGVWLHGRAARIAANCVNGPSDPRWLSLPDVTVTLPGGRVRRRPEPVAANIGHPIIASDIVAALGQAITEALQASNS